MRSHSWTLKITPADAPRTVVFGLSPDEMRSALSALVHGDVDRLDATIARVAERDHEDLAA